jgi:predicted nucleic acid-binding protein
MEPHYLLDTNMCIYIRQKRPDEVLRRFQKLRPGEAVLSVITYGELLYGAAKSRQRVAALERLRDLVICSPHFPYRKPRLRPVERFAPKWKQKARSSETTIFGSLRVLWHRG